MKPVKPASGMKELKRWERCGWLLSMVTHPTFRHEMFVALLMQSVTKKQGRKKLCEDLVWLHARAKEARKVSLRGAAGAKKTMMKFSRLLRAVKKK